VSVNLVTALDDYNSATARSEGWVFFSIPESSVAEFTEKSSAILSKTTMRAFHGKEFVRRFETITFIQIRQRRARTEHTGPKGISIHSEYRITPYSQSAISNLPSDFACNWTNGHDAPEPSTKHDHRSRPKALVLSLYCAPLVDTQVPRSGI
jgi:hypothetical protein